MNANAVWDSRPMERGDYETKFMTVKSSNSFLRVKITFYNSAFSTPPFSHLFS